MRQTVQTAKLWKLQSLGDSSGSDFRAIVLGSWNLDWKICRPIINRVVANKFAVQGLH